MAQPRLEDLFGMGKGGDPSNYRDRDTRREDLLPKMAARLKADRPGPANHRPQGVMQRLPKVIQKTEKTN